MGEFELVMGQDEGHEAVMAMLEEQAVAQAAAGRTDTAAARIAKHREAIEKLDAEKLMAIQEGLADLVDLIFKNQLSPGEDMTEERAEALMREHLARTDARLFLEARNNMVKEVVFAAITAQLRKDGVADPENTNGSLPAPALGKRFARQGCGRSAPHFDEEMLAEALGAQRWEQVCDVTEHEAYTITQEVPAHRECTFSLDKFFALARQHPELLEVGADCLIPGQEKKPSLAVQPYHPEKT